MKSNVMPSIVQLEAKALKELTREVKETVATDLLQSDKIKGATFGAIDLWKVRRKVKTARASFNWEY